MFTGRSPIEGSGSGPGPTAGSSTDDNAPLVRGRAELDAMFQEVLAARRSIARYPRNHSHVRRLNGIAAALGWVLGKTMRSPVTNLCAYGVHPASDGAAVRYELGLARCHVQLVADAGDRAYLYGVVGALSWTTEDVAQPPC